MLFAKAFLALPPPLQVEEAHLSLFSLRSSPWFPAQTRHWIPVAHIFRNVTLGLLRPAD